MNNDLFKAILAMDSYYRGYDAGIDITGNKIGNATIKTTTNSNGETINLDSQILEDENGNRLDDDFGFYALTYDLGDGEYVIAHRGTDYPGNDTTIPKDIANGWPMGGGFATPQGILAIGYYNAVVDQMYPVSTSWTRRDELLR